MKQKEHATFTFGRFSPPTTGHKKLVDAVVSHANAHKGDHFIFASQSHDPQKNPLPHKEKISFMRKLFPHANVDDSAHVKTALHAVKHLHDKGYKKVTMIVGGDRVQEFHNLLHKYNGKDYNIPHLEVKSAGDRDPDAEGVEGMSASKMRLHASKKEFGEFRKGVPNPVHAKELYHAVRKGMKLEHFQKTNKATFLVGGPGSGKDFIIRSILEGADLHEISLDKLVKAIIDKNNLPELNDNPSLIVNGTAEDFLKVKISKQVLESMGYETSLIYVYTTNDESKARNDERMAKGLKTISESVRAQKYSASLENLENFDSIFDVVCFFDNTDDYNTVNEQQQYKITQNLNHVGQVISEFFITPNKQEEINSLFEAEFKETPKKKKKTKQAAPPPTYMDSRVGAIPSLVGGLTAEAKSFKDLRKNLAAKVNNEESFDEE